MAEELDTIVEYSVDLKNQEAPIPLPVGEYRAQIRNVEVRMSQRDTKYAAVSFWISPDQYPADFTEGSEDGETIVYRRVPLEDNPKSRFQCKQFLEAIEAPISNRIDTTQWNGLSALVGITHEEWEGMPRANITKVSRA